jgi:conjugal transfer pilus assembly protein TraV
MRTARRWMVFPCLSLLTGCAGTYGCKGFPDLPICKSAVEAFQATDGAVSSTKPEDNQALSAANPVPRVEVPGSLRAIAPNPRFDDPTPIRTPPKIMRIWIAPWEDNEGDLQVSSYVFTELEPRRWMIGKPASPNSPTLKPLQVAQRHQKAAGEREPPSLMDVGVTQGVRNNLPSLEEEED